METTSTNNTGVPIVPRPQVIPHTSRISDRPVLRSFLGSTPSSGSIASRGKHLSINLNSLQITARGSAGIILLSENQSILFHTECSN